MVKCRDSLFWAPTAINNYQLLFLKGYSMKHYFTALIFFLAFAFVTHTQAAALFSDDFQDSAASKSKWIFPGEVTSTFGNGAVTLANADPDFMWFVTHNFASKSPTFTLSATITFRSGEGAGLVCCKTDYNGIVVTLGNNQNLLVYKMIKNSKDQIEQTELLNVFNSFINTTSNVLTVSKRESTLNFFCNNNFIGSVSVTEPLFTGGGDIAMVIPSKASSIFDNVVMTDEFLQGSKRTCFSDDFNDADVNGWYTYTISGTFQSGGGRLAVSNTDTVYSGLLLVNGDFSRSSLKVITSFASGKGVYGCIFVYSIPLAGGGNSYKTYSFLVDSTRRYGVSIPDSPTIKMNVPKTFVHGATGDGKDTLEIGRFNNRYEFKINGTVAENTLPVPSRTPDGAGIYVGPKTSVSFRMFAVGGDSTGASCPVVLASGNPNQKFLPFFQFPQNGSAMFDALGRINKRFEGMPSAALQRGASGVYFLRSAQGGKNASIRIKTSVK
jgi:hypothetical protein